MGGNGQDCAGHKDKSSEAILAIIWSEITRLVRFILSSDS